MQQIAFLLQNLMFAQHVSGTIMPIIRSSRFIQMVAACGTWRFGLQVVGLVWSYGLCVRFAGCCSILFSGHQARDLITHDLEKHHNPGKGFQEKRSVLVCILIFPTTFV